MSRRRTRDLRAKATADERRRTRRQRRRDAIETARLLRLKREPRSKR